MARLQLLLTEKRELIDGPSSKVIDYALRKIFAGKETWATLSLSPYYYVTTSGSIEKGFDLECEMSSPDLHYKVKGERLDIDALVRVFQSFAGQDDSWFDDFKWDGVRLTDINYKRTPKHIIFKPNLFAR